jgi:hypothetical protein
MASQACLRIAGGILLLLATMMGVADVADAQTIDTEPADTAGNRPQPAYDAVGIRRGSVIIRPDLAVNPSFNSNVFARDTNVISGFAVTLIPSLHIQRARPGAILALAANARIRRYAELVTQNDEQYSANLQGGITLGQATQVAANVGWSRSTVSRGTSENSLQIGDPVRQNTMTAAVRVSRRFNRLTASLSGSGEKSSIGDVRLDDGTVLDQSFRNGRTVGASAALSYDVGPRLAVVTRVQITDFAYSDPRPETNRDATDVALTAGGRFEINELIFAEFTAGFRRHAFHGSAFSDISGLAISGRLRWYPTRLLSLRADVGQRVTTSVFDNVSAVTITSAKLSGDYELRRNLLVSANADFSHERFSGVVGNSLRMEIGGGFKWKSNRWLHLGGSVNYERRNRSLEGIAPKYDGLRVLLNVTVAR